MTDFITEQTPLLHSRERAFDPVRGHVAASDSTDGGHSRLMEDCMGDWSWKPLRDRALGQDTLFKKSDFVTFRGVPPGAAELYGRVRRS